MYVYPKNTYRVLKIILSLVLVLLIKICAFNPFWVEEHFSTYFFLGFSNFLRMVTGWVSFSVGDVFYFAAAAWLLYKILRFFPKLVKNNFRLRILGASLLNILLTATAVYIVFNVFWGLNYNRRGLKYQLGVDVKNYTIADLQNIQQLLIQNVNKTKELLSSTNFVYPTDQELFLRANKCYQQTGLHYPFMQYKYASVKSSLYSWWGNYLGFTGYYNPFSGEAQVNTTVPRFILPFTTCHEIAHQIGYAKEDEANFAGYLAATSSTDTLFRYSAYLELFIYANHELYFNDSTLAKQAFTQLSPQVKADVREWRDFLIKHRSFADAFVTWAYGKYLKANQQPMGMQSYNEVIADLIAFYKKTGRI